MLCYNLGKGNSENFIIGETDFDPFYIKKTETVFCQGNGYMGIRGGTEEDYAENSRMGLVTGTFDWMERRQTPELASFADLVAAQITASGEWLDLKKIRYSDYERSLNLYDGLLCRRFVWNALECRFERFVSLHDRHLMGQRMTFRAGEDTVLTLRTGILGGARYGDAHFNPGTGSIEGQTARWIELTHQSKLAFRISARLQATLNGKEITLPMVAETDFVGCNLCVTLHKGQTLVLEKIGRVTTDRDVDQNEHSFAAHAQHTEDFDTSFAKSAAAWEALWKEKDVKITCEDGYDQLSLRYAIFQLTGMSPLHDSRMNIGAKGFSGAGYQGHSFWDTEIYMLPFFIFTDPKGAKSLLKYRYHYLPSAKQNAAGYGYKGAMFPWESAWLTDGECCPDKSFPKWEIHITADVAYGVLSYYAATGDMEFMEQYGAELLYETAKFWSSRLEWNGEKGRYEITDVIGPDEFSRHVSNNAYTNYFAHMNIAAALGWQKLLGRACPEVDEMQDQLAKLYLPEKNAEGILPQDDTYMGLPTLDIEIYRRGEKKLREDHPAPGCFAYRVSKQADVMVLFLLMEDLFDKETKRKSFYYYEPYCVHESSLSLCSYSMLAADIGEKEQAYALYTRANRIDLGQKPTSSDEGLHAASLGGIWQMSVLGFGGIRAYGDTLRICPNLPEGWQSICGKIYWKGVPIHYTIEKERICLSAPVHKPFDVITPVGTVCFTDRELNIKYERRT